MREFELRTIEVYEIRLPIKEEDLQENVWLTMDVPYHQVKSVKSAIRNFKSKVRFTYDLYAQVLWAFVIPPMTTVLEK